MPATLPRRPRTHAAKPESMTPDERFRGVVELWTAALLRLHAKGRLPVVPPAKAASKKGSRPR